MILIWLGISIFSVIALRQVCICVFNDKYGIQVNKDFFFSTELSRSYHIPQVCENREVCHIYATLAEDTSTSVFINVQTGIYIQELTIKMMSDSGNF